MTRNTRIGLRSGLAHIDNRLVRPFHNNYLFLIVDTIPIVDTVGELVEVLDRGDDIGQAKCFQATYAARD